VTEPVFKRINRGRNHTYQRADGTPLTGVTTILGKGLPKPALTTWAANEAAGYAVDHWDELAEQPPSVRLAKIKRAPWDSRDKAALRGTDVHRIAEQLSLGQEAAYDESQQGHVDSYLKFLQDWQVQPVWTETPVANLAVGYAGTLDMVADLVDGRRWLLDVKTGKGVYGETAFQLAAYRYAQVALVDGQQLDMVHVDACGVVHVRADGYDLVPVTADADVFLRFRYIQQCALAAEAANDYIGAVATP